MGPLGNLLNSGLRSGVLNPFDGDIIPGNQGINKDQVLRQVADPGGDYDLSRNLSYNGGVRNPTSNNVAGGVWGGLGGQGQSQPGYDSTGRPVPANEPSMLTQWTPNAGSIAASQKYYYPNGSEAPDAATARAAAAQAGWYGDQIGQLEGQMGVLGNQEGIGLGNINNSYNRQSNRLGEQKAMGQRNYETSRNQTIQGYSNTRNGIMNQTGAHLNALQRLLSINGSGNSSASRDVVPYAAAMVGSQALSGAQQTYGNNLGSLDTSWEDTQRQYGNALEDLNQQKYSQEQGLRSSIASTRASLLEKIAQAQQNRELARGGGYEQARAAANPYMEQVNSLLSQITQLGNQYQNPVMRAGDVSFKAPDLGQYTLGQGMSGPSNPATQTPQGSGANPLLAGLMNREETDEFGNPLRK